MAEPLLQDTVNRRLGMSDLLGEIELVRLRWVRALKACPERSEGRRLGEDAGLAKLHRHGSVVQLLSVGLSCRHSVAHS